MKHDFFFLKVSKEEKHIALVMADESTRSSRISHYKSNICHDPNWATTGTHTYPKFVMTQIGP